METVFDQPYLEERCRRSGLPSPFGELPSIDLYQSLRSCQTLFKLSRMKQLDLENLFPSIHRIHCDGGQCIRLYRSYIKKEDPSALETVLGHNQEDLCGLGSVYTLLSYKFLYLGEYEPSAVRMHGQEELVITLALKHPVPVPVSCVTEEFYLTVNDSEAKLLLHLRDGKLRQYYPNYKDYEYLPGEDQAIPKSLSRYVDKSLRTAAHAPDLLHLVLLRRKFPQQQTETDAVPDTFSPLSSQKSRKITQKNPGRP